MAGDHEVWERYARWEGTYTGRAGQRPLSTSALRTATVVGAVVTVAAFWYPATAVPSEGVTGLLMPVLLSCLVVPWWVLTARRAPQTRLSQAGLSVRAGVLAERRVAWGQVREVQPPGPFDHHPVAVLASGERLELVGLPAEAAREMAGAGSRAAWAPADPPPMRQQSSPQPPTRGLPDPGDDLDGPFHRGRSPRRDDRGGGRG